VKGLADFVGRVTDAYGVTDANGEGIDGQMDAVIVAIEGIDATADLRHGSPRLAALLQEWSDASSRLSEQLGLRFFSHSGEVNRQTFAT
jgi:hypothetical protein